MWAKARNLSILNFSSSPDRHYLQNNVHRIFFISILPKKRIILLCNGAEFLYNETNYGDGACQVSRLYDIDDGGRV